MKQVRILEDSDVEVIVLRKLKSLGLIEEIEKAQLPSKVESIDETIDADKTITFTQA